MPPPACARSDPRRTCRCARKAATGRSRARSVRARAAGAAALALATVLGGCGGGEGKGSDADQVTAAATTFAHAFGTGDGKKACSLLTPGAQDAFVKRVSSLVGTNDCAQAIVKLQAV